MEIVDKDIGHDELSVGGEILVSTKRLDMGVLLRELPGNSEAWKDLLSTGLHDPYIETMILADRSKYKFGGFQQRYPIQAELRAARRHRWIVWVIREMLGLPHAPRPSRYAFLGSDSDSEG